jgi:hypothetical protein
MKTEQKQFEISGYVFYIHERVYDYEKNKIDHALLTKNKYKLGLLSDFVLDIHGGKLLKNRYGMKFILDNFRYPEKTPNFLNKEYTMIAACKAKEIVEQKTEQYLQEVVLPQYIKLANELVNKVIESNPFYYQASLDIPSVDHRFINQIASKIEEYGYKCITYSSDGFADAYIKIEWK